LRHIRLRWWWRVAPSAAMGSFGHLKIGLCKKKGTIRDSLFLRGDMVLNMFFLMLRGKNI
jgi:hypothetical protein